MSIDTKTKSYFISGHRDITVEEFNMYYRDRIIKAMSRGYSFTIGDCPGVDTMAQQLLKDYPNVTIYHIGDAPMYIEDKFDSVGGFSSDFYRDIFMSRITNGDILWIRDNKVNSGTHMNQKRREWLKTAGQITPNKLIQRNVEETLENVDL